MNRETALRKVLRCLRMAASSNPNEAATALRQARAMMDAYGLTEADAYASEIHNAEAPTRCRGGKPTQSVIRLITLVAAGFRCKPIMRRTVGFGGAGSTVILFYGAGSDAQVAAYAFTVLRRQLEADRSRHTRRIRKRANKDARGEAFAIGWVTAVSNLFPGSEIDADRKRAIEMAIGPETEQTAGREISKSGKANANDRYAGFLAGAKARVNAGVEGSAPAALEHAG